MKCPESIYAAKKIILPYVVIELFSNNIMRFEFTRNLNVNMAPTLERMEVCKKLSSDKLYLSLKIIKHTFKIDDDVTDFFASNVRKGMMTAETVFISSATLKMFANFYFRVKKPLTPGRVFETESEALNWLLTNNEH